LCIGDTAEERILLIPEKSGIKRRDTFDQLKISLRADLKSALCRFGQQEVVALFKGSRVAL
jgi:hypothetical protein